MPVGVQGGVWGSAGPGRGTGGDSGRMAWLDKASAKGEKGRMSAWGSGGAGRRGRRVAGAWVWGGEGGWLVVCGGEVRLG